MHISLYNIFSLFEGLYIEIELMVCCPWLIFSYSVTIIKSSSILYVFLTLVKQFS